MANTPFGLPNLLTDPGFLYWAPIGTALPTNTILASKFSDVWATPWVPMGATDTGSDFNSTTTVQPIMCAELLDPIAYRSTDRQGNFTFALLDITMTKLSWAFNGAAKTVTGATTTTLTQLSPVQLGSETRAMIGWESLDTTVRIIAPQVFNSGDVKLSQNKAPARASIPWTGNFEIPASGTLAGMPWQIWGAGMARG